MRGTQTIFAGFEDGGQEQEARNVGGLEMLGTVLCSQPARKGGPQPDKLEELNSANNPNEQGNLSPPRNSK